MIKSILGSMTTITASGLHWLVELPEALDGLAVLVALTAGLLTIVYTLLKIIEWFKRR